MRASVIVKAIAAMREAHHLGYQTEPEQFSKIIVALYLARVDMETELGKLDIQVEADAPKVEA